MRLITSPETAAVYDLIIIQTLVVVMQANHLQNWSRQWYIKTCYICVCSSSQSEL